MLQSLGNHCERGAPAEFNTDFLVGPSVHGQRGRNFDIRLLERHQFLFPIVILELKEERSQRSEVIKRHRGWKRSHRRRSDSRSGSRGDGTSVEADSTASQGVERCAALCRVQFLVSVPVVAGQHLLIGATERKLRAGSRRDKCGRDQCDCETAFQPLVHWDLAGSLITGLSGVAYLSSTLTTCTIAPETH